MQVRITDVNIKSVLTALENNSFGVAIHRTEDEEITQVDIWTGSMEDDDGNYCPCGYKAGIIRREMASFAKYEVVIETNRIPVDQFIELMGEIAQKNA